VVVSCEHGNELSGSIKCEELAELFGDTASWD
jgi:hypothetical protein